MNRINKQIISAIVSVSLFTGFVGCGSTTQEEINLTPHMKDTRTLEKDWTWDVGVKYMGNLVFSFYSKRPENIGHYQLFIDYVQGGFDGENGWEVYGADALIEDGKFFEYENNKWVYKKDISFKYLFTQNELRIQESNHPFFKAMYNISGAKPKFYLEFYDKGDNWGGNYPTVVMENVDLNSDNSIDSEKFEIIDTKFSPKTFSNLAVSNDGKVMFVLENGSYKTKGSLTALDISDPHNVSVISKIEVPKNSSSISVSKSGAKMYILKRSEKVAFYSVDISNLKSMKVEDSYILNDTQHVLGDIQIINDKAYVLGAKPVKDNQDRRYQSAITVFDISSSNIVQEKRVVFDKYISHFTISEDLHYLYGIGMTKAYVFDLFDNAKIVSTLDDIFTMDDLLISKDKKTLFIVGNEGEHGGHIIDISNPAKLTRIDYIDTWDSSRKAVQTDDMLLVINNGVQFWDISDISHKTLLDSVTFNHYAPTDIVVNGDKAYVVRGGSNGYFKIIDLSKFR